MFHVKRFHVKRFVKVNKTILLTYTKIPEDHIEQVFHIDPTQQLAQGPSRDPQIFRGQLLALFDDADAAPERDDCCLQQFTLPLAADQTALPRAKITLRKRNQG